MTTVGYIILAAVALVATLPYAYLVGRMVGTGYFAAKLDHHRQILAEHAMLGLDHLEDDDKEREEDNGRTLSTQSP